jgi:hypothetical protein
MTTAWLDGEEEGETRKTPGNFYNNDNQHEYYKKIPYFDYRGGLIMTSGRGINFSTDDPCFYPWFGHEEKVVNMKEYARKVDAWKDDAIEEDGTIHNKHDDRDRDEGCAIEFEFRCASGRDEDVEAYEAGFDYLISGPHTSEVPQEDIGAVEFFLNGMAMLTHSEAVVGSIRVERHRGSRRVRGSVDMVPMMMVKKK